VLHVTVHFDEEQASEPFATDGHLLPQPPQLLLSVLSSTHALPHIV